MADKIKSFMVPVTLCEDQGVLALVHEHGEDALAKIVRVMCACASQQMRPPLYMWDVSDGTYGWEMLSEKCRFQDVESCQHFVFGMARHGIASLEHSEGRSYVTCPQVLEDAASYTEKIEKKRAAGRASAEARRKAAAAKQEQQE